MPVFTVPIHEHGTLGQANYPHPEGRSRKDVAGDAAGVNFETSGQLASDIKGVFGKKGKAVKFAETLLKGTPWDTVTVKSGEVDFEDPFSGEQSVEFVLTGTGVIGKTSVFSEDGDRYAEIGLVWIEEQFRDQGLAKPILRSMVKAYEQQKISRVTLTAVDLGSYAWLRYGFVPDDGERFAKDVRKRLGQIARQAQAGMGNTLSVKVRQHVETLLKRVEDGDAYAAWEIADLRDGKRNIGLEVMRSITWSGELDLKDKRQRKRFDAYIGGKK